MRDLQVIIGHAQHVMRVLGKGYRESDYCKALQTSFSKAMIAHRREVICPNFFMDEIIGFGRADFVMDQFVVEIKANKLRVESASDQLAKYLKSLKRVEKKDYVGIILNFNQTTGKVESFVQENPKNKTAKTTRVVSRFFKKKN